MNEKRFNNINQINKIKKNKYLLFHFLNIFNHGDWGLGIENI